MIVEKLEQTDFISMDWKNKQGKTQQLAIYPPNSTVADLSFEWRISIASMQAPNSFSNFSGYNRTILQLDGFQFPMKLIHKGDTPKEVTLQPLTPYHFSGNDVIDCDIAGLVRDFNVMTKQTTWNATVDVMKWKEAQSECIAISHAKVGFVYCVDGLLKLKDGTLLHANEALHVTRHTGDGDALNVDICEASSVIIVQLSN